jgi:hypothetical protein
VIKVWSSGCVDTLFAFGLLGAGVELVYVNSRLQSIHVCS